MLNNSIWVAHNLCFIRKYKTILLSMFTNFKAFYLYRPEWLANCGTRSLLGFRAGPRCLTKIANCLWGREYYRSFNCGLTLQRSKETHRKKDRLSYIHEFFPFISMFLERAIQHPCSSSGNSITADTHCCQMLRSSLAFVSSRLSRASLRVFTYIGAIIVPTCGIQPN